MTITASQILDLLATKHNDDIFVPECKDGPSAGHTHLRLDAWTMKRSYTQFAMTGYEIKVSRADFLSDDKWHHYLPLCNHLYFVAPPDIIQLAEVPPSCGLMHVSRNAKRLLTKVKSPFREVEIPNDLFIYILMSRAFIGHEHTKNNDRNVAYWQQWLRTRDEKKDLGWRVSKKLSQLVHEKIDVVAAENSRLNDKIKTLEKAKTILAGLGIDTTSGYSYNLQERIEQALTFVPPRLIRALKETGESLGTWRQEQLEKLQEEPPADEKPPLLWECDECDWKGKSGEMNGYECPRCKATILPF